MGAAKARVWRSTQTSPNSGTIRDLTTAFGAGPNNTTVAAFPLAGASGFQWSPNTAAAAVNPPADPAAAVTGKGWRDTVAENPAEQVTYAAGTWTVRARLNKTVMTVNAAVTVRVTAVVFQVDSSGAWKDEIGRVVFADTALATVGAPVSVSGSFVTGSSQVFAAGDKIQVEVYVQNIVAGTAAAAVAAYTVALVTDETNANSGSAFTALPAFTTQFARAATVTGVGTPAMSRQLALSKSFSVTGVETAAMSRRLTLARAFTVTGPATAVAARRLDALRAFSVTGAGTAAAARRLTLARGFSVTGVGSVAMSRLLTLARAFSVTGVGAVSYLKNMIFSRRFSVSGTGTARLRVDMPEAVLDRMEPGGAGPTDWPLTPPLKTIVGVVRDAQGNPYEGATVQLVRQADGFVAGAMTSGPGGAYSFDRGTDDPYTYFVVAWEETGAPTQGVSERGQVPE